MLHSSDILNLIAEYDALVMRAIRIARPYHDEGGKLDDDSGNLVLVTLGIDSGYYDDSASIGETRNALPWDLMLMSDDDFEAWHEQRAATEKEAAAREAADDAVRQEANERRVLANLMKKYGEQT